MIERETLGDIIRDLRKRKNMTQEDLAEGICSPVSISRIENGTQMPSSNVLEALLSKLGTSTYQICNIYYKSDKQIAFENKADVVADLLKEGNLDKASCLLENLKEETCDNLLNEQYYLLLLATLKIYKNESAEDIIGILKKSLALTKKDFNYRDFRNVLLTVREANIISLILIAFFNNNQVLDAIYLGEELVTSLDKHGNKLKDYSLIRINAGINLAQCLEKESRYTEALSRCDEVEKISYQLSEHTLLPEILFIKAKQFFFLGDENECKRILQVIYPYMQMINKRSYSGVVKEFARRELNLLL